MLWFDKSGTRCKCASHKFWNRGKPVMCKKYCCWSSCQSTWKYHWQSITNHIPLQQELEILKSNLMLERLSSLKVDAAGTRIMHVVCISLCFVVALYWSLLIYPSGYWYPSVLLLLHRGNHYITPVSAKYPWTHWGRMMHICISKQTIIGSDNGLCKPLSQPMLRYC